MNGPALAVAGARVALAWYTQGGGSRVQIAWSEDGGESFGKPQRVDAREALGRVDLCAGPEDRVLVSWLMRSAAESEGAAWAARGCAPDGSLESGWFTLGGTSTSRDAGILRLAADARGWIAAAPAANGRGLVTQHIERLVP